MIRVHELPACRRYYQAPALLNATGYIPMFLSEDDDRSAREHFAGNLDKLAQLDCARRDHTLDAAAR